MSDRNLPDGIARQVPGPDADVMTLVDWHATCAEAVEGWNQAGSDVDQHEAAWRQAQADARRRIEHELHRPLGALAGAALAAPPARSTPCGHCGHDTLLVEWALAMILRGIARIEKHDTKEEKTMSELSDRLDSIKTSLSTVSDDLRAGLTDVERALNDFRNGALTDEQRAQFGDIDNAFGGLKQLADNITAVVEAVDATPQPAPAQPTTDPTA